MRQMTYYLLAEENLEGAEQYGVRVESETGVGTSFFLSFRREPLPAPKEEP